ncbi:hypothetical protein JCM8547_008648 [Rhodosporidiobolus lusitaniae]
MATSPGDANGCRPINPSAQTMPSTGATLHGPSPPAGLTGSEAPWSYLLIRWLFRLVLGVFYSSVVVEGAENVPGDGVPCMVTANHSNSLTDALLLVTSIPSSRRSLLRLTAKDTQFGRGTFTSRLIAASGTLPIQRPKDHLGKKVDNSVVFEKLIDALGEKGDAVCVFPEGMSRYKSGMAELRQGVSRIVAETLRRQQGREGFKIAVQTCSITYLHRNLFRSDVLVTFHPPLYLTPQSHPSLLDPTSSDFEPSIRSLTSSIATSIRSGLIDAPSWSALREAHTARRLYAPLGTRLTLGDHVRLTRRFVEALSGRTAERRWEEEEGVEERGKVLKTPMREKKPVEGGGFFEVEGEKEDEEEGEMTEKDLEELRRDLKDLLYLHGLKDDRIRNPRLLRRRTLLKRLFVRLVTSYMFLLLALPGLPLWLPIFWATKRATEKMKKKGPAWDTYDEIAQTKLAVGLGSGLAILTLASLLTFPFLPFLNLPVLLSLMWLTLRFLEDLTSSLRAALALSRLLFMGKKQLKMLREMRSGLRERVERLAVERAGLPRDAGVFVRQRERRLKVLGLGRLEGGVREWLRFVDPRRRRKKDWNEALKLFDQTEYAEDEEEDEKKA